MDINELSAQAKVNLIHHHSLHVLAFLRRNHKFANTPIPSIAPSNINSFTVSPTPLHNHNPSPPITDQYTNPALFSTPNNDQSTTTTTTTSYPSPTSSLIQNQTARHAPPSPERDAYLKHCHKLFSFAGQSSTSTTSIRTNNSIFLNSSKSRTNSVAFHKSGSKVDCFEDKINKTATTDLASPTVPVAIHFESAVTDHPQSSVEKKQAHKTLSSESNEEPESRAVLNRSPLLSKTSPTSSPPSSPTLPPTSVQQNKQIALPASVLIQGFEELLKRLSTLPSPTQLSEHVSPLFLVTPFVRVIQSGDATGPITSAVMHALITFIKGDVIGSDDQSLHFADIQLAVKSMVATVHKAKFQSIDLTSDDLVLYRILDLASTLVNTMSLFLTDEAVCQLFELGLSVWMMADVSEIVHKHALNLLESMVQLVFADPNLKLDLTAKSSATSPDSNVSSPNQVTAASASEIIRVLASILVGEPTPSSESSLVLAHHLIQHLITVTNSAHVKEVIVSTYIPPCLNLLALQTQPTGSNQYNGPITGIGLTAPLEYHATKSPSINVLVMTWHTIQTLWTSQWPILSPFYELLMGYLLVLEESTGPQSNRYRGSSNFSAGGATRTSTPGTNQSPGSSSTSTKQRPSESWEVRQARILVLKQITTAPSLLFALWAYWDCHPDRPDLLKRLVEYHCQLLESTIPGMLNLGLDFLRTFLIILNNAQPQINQKQRTSKQRKAQVYTALELFRTSPKKSIEYMVKAGILSSKDPKIVADFLFHTPGIDKSVVGEYISKPVNSEILTAYITQFEFKDLRMDQALRLIMQRFRLPGESQMIDRILDTFAKHYFKHNPDQKDIANMDAGFILAFSLIMLNTDQHNPQVRNRMDLDSFCRNLRGLNNKHDFRKEFLHDMFHAIQSNEITDEISLEYQMDLAVAQTQSFFTEQDLELESADTEAMLQNVFPIMLEGLLASNEPKVLSCLALLAQKPECTESLLARLALKSMLSPIQSAASLNNASSTNSVNQTTPTKPPSSVKNQNGVAPIAASSICKPKLSHTHLILFFSTLYHQRSSLTTTAKEYAIHALANLFVHDLLPDTLMQYQDPVRSRFTQIPILAIPESSPTENDVPAEQAELQPMAPKTQLDNMGRSSTPNPSIRTTTPSASVNAPRAGASIFSFFSYISTTFTATPALNEEDLLVKDVLSECHLDEVIVSVITFDGAMSDARTYPHLAAFFTILLLMSIQAHPESTKSVSNPSNTVAQFRNHLLELMNLAPQVVVTVAIRASVHWPELLAEDLSFAQRIVGTIQNVPDVLSVLTLSQSTSSSVITSPTASLQALPVLAIIPYLSSMQFIETIRKCKSPELAVALLNAKSIVQLEEGDLKEVIMVVYRLLIRADSVETVRSLANAALLPSVYGAIVAQGSCGIEYLKLFAVVALHPSVTQVRSLQYLERALFTMQPAIEVLFVPGLVKEVLVPLLFQYRVLISDADKMRDKTIGKTVKNGCFMDQARATAMMVKYHTCRLSDMPVAQIDFVWQEVVNAINSLMTMSPVNEQLVEIAVPILENAVRVMHSVGNFTDATSGEPTKLWKLTHTKVGKLLPELEQSLFQNNSPSIPSRSALPSNPPLVRGTSPNKSPSIVPPSSSRPIPVPQASIPPPRPPSVPLTDPFQLAHEANQQQYNAAQSTVKLTESHLQSQSNPEAIPAPKPNQQDDTSYDEVMDI